jgi:hypothetical protein
MSKDIGDIAETKVLAELIEQGYAVSIPYGDNQRYDLLVDDDGEIHRVQVKNGAMEDGCVRFECKTAYTDHNGERKYHSYDSSEIDAYAVWSSEQQSVYWIPIEDAGSSAMRLRVEDTLDRYTSQTNWAEDYNVR